MNRFGFSAETFGMISQNSIYVSRVKISEETFFLFFFSEFFGFWAKIFSDFRRKIFKKLSKLPSAWPDEQFVAWIFFKNFESFRIFCRNLWHGSQKCIYVSRVKIAEKKFFFCLFSEFFRFLGENFSAFWPRNFKKMWKLPSACPQEQLVTLYLLKKFWTVLDFLQKPLAWFSKFYLRVQSKNFGRNSFLIFLFRIFFSDFERKIFSDFRPKNFKKFSKLLSTCPEEQFVAWNFFLKFWIVLDFLQKPSAWFSKFYLRVQSKNCGRNSFLIFLFRFFPDFERKIFQTFGQKTSRKCENYLLSVQRNNL